MKKGLILFCMASVLTVLPSYTQERVMPPEDYPYDGCSMFPDGNYRECCIAHDRDYFIGGTRSERRASDKRLRDCVRSKGRKYISGLMYLGVRIGGVSFLPTPFRWGFGQPKNRK